jgi:hypothetical protein
MALLGKDAELQMQEHTWSWCCGEEDDRRSRACMLLPKGSLFAGGGWAEVRGERKAMAADRMPLIIGSLSKDYSQNKN